MMPLKRDGPADSPTTIVLAHGAGAGMDTPFMNEIAAGLGQRGLHVVRFEFSYMQRARAQGKRKPPDRMPKLRETYHDVVGQLSAGRIVVGGKSMGGRVASMVADELSVDGLVCLGYPFHPPGKPDALRTSHLEQLTTPTLIIQGSRDPFGTRSQVEGYALSARIDLCWLEDGDHSFKPRVKSGLTLAQHMEAATQAVADFCLGLDS